MGIKRLQNLFLLYVIGVMLISIGIGRSHAQTICNVPISGLMGCRPAITPPNPTLPTAGCCSALAGADLRCLCSYKNSTLLPSLGIDPNLALQLPAKCHLPHTPNC
ncbi:hypothetical protein M5689_022362 [Euphorbia peplus]|nr:hypothetical protein M5689_022362 [Euphorbia peplus]